jgi:hypothetical protein
MQSSTGRELDLPNIALGWFTDAISFGCIVFKSCQPHVFDTNTWVKLQTALMQACRFGHWEVVQTLLVFRCNVSECSTVPLTMLPFDRCNLQKLIWLVCVVTTQLMVV